MKTFSKLQPYVALLIVASLCACGGGSAAAPYAGAASSRNLTSIARWAAPKHADRRKSWFAPELAKAKASTLFVSDSGTGDVYIYSLPALKVLATITGFDQPQGECSDNKGNVWVTDTNAQKIYELSRHGYLENELSDSLGWPAACAFDPSTGNLAVMNLFGLSGANGAVLIYPKAKGAPDSYTNPSESFYNFGSFHDGNLFFDGRDANGNFMLSELAKGSKSATTISIHGGTIYFPGTVEWDVSANDLIVGDQACGYLYANCFYGIAVAKGVGAVKRTTNVQNASGGGLCDLVQAVEFNGQLAGSDNNYCGSSTSATYLALSRRGSSYELQQRHRHNAGWSGYKQVNAIKRRPIYIAAVALSLCGCSQSSSLLASPTTLPASRVSSNGDLSQQDLLYVSNSNGEVTVYKYWQHTLIGVLTNFTHPAGECSDQSGNVFITDSAAQRIPEYAHGGTQPIATLNDAPNSPVACSVEASSGNLAVANNDGTTAQGNIAIFAKAGGTPTTYTSSQLMNFGGCAYDTNGNLLVSSTDMNPALFAWLPANGTKLITVSIPGPKPGWTWRYIDGLQWDGKFFAIDADDYIFRESLIRGQIYYVGETELNNLGSFWIYRKMPDEQGTQVVGSYSGNSVAFWKYPSGGTPIAQISHGIDGPVGVTISLHKKK